MADVEFDNDWDSSKQQVAYMLGRLDRAVFGDGNGSPGMQRILAVFLAEQKTRTETLEKVEAQRHQENQDRLVSQNTKSNWLIALTGLVALLLTGLGIYIAWKEYQSHGHAAQIISSEPSTIQALDSQVPPHN